MSRSFKKRIVKTCLKKRIIKTCLTCNKKFDLYPSSNKRKYCSRKCYLKIKIKPKFLLKTLCVFCNEEFSYFSLKNSDQNSKYKACNNCKNKKRTGKYNPNWRGGLSHKPYSRAFNNELKDYVKERDNHKCVICGHDGFWEGLNVHHIDYDKNNNDMNNLITLCNTCHSKTNFNRKFWVKYFNELN